MSEWKPCQLDEVANIGMGQSPDSSSYNDKGKGYPFLQGCSEFGSTYPSVIYYCDHPRRIAPKDSILISVRAPVGELNRANREYCIGRGLGYISYKSANIEYLYYLLFTKRHDLERVSQGSTFEAINSHELKSLKLILPPIPEQKKISRILTTVDNLIEKTEALIEKYKAIKQGMMHDLFTRGVDENGKLRPPYEEAPDLYKESELGWIPKEWDVSQVGNLCQTASGGTPSRDIPDYWNGEIPWVKTGEIRYKDIEDTEEKITKLGLSKSAATLLPAGTVVMALFGQGPTRGRVARLGIAATVNQACLAFIPTNALSADYLYSWFVSSYKDIRSLSNDGAQQNLNSSLVKSVMIPLPDELEQKRISTIFKTFDKWVDTEIVALKEMREQKQGLMQDLLTGKVRVNVDELEEVTANV